MTGLGCWEVVHGHVEACEHAGIIPFGELNVSQEEIYVFWRLERTLTVDDANPKRGTHVGSGSEAPSGRQGLQRVGQLRLDFAFSILGGV